MKEDTSTKEIALLGICDRLGRGDMTSEKQEDEMKAIEIFMEKCNNFGNNAFRSH
jgi:hypothetical protein